MRPRQGRARKAYHSDGRAIHPKIEKQTDPPQKMHKVCANRAEIREKTTKPGELGAPEWRVKRAVSPPRAASARRSPAESLPRRSWWDNFPYSRRSSKWFFLRPRKLF